MKVALKLTDNECRVVNNKTKHIMFIERCIEDGSGGVIEVQNVDKFREFLNDEIKSIYKKVDDSDFKPDVSFLKLSHLSLEQPLKNLKSILSKLDKAVVQNDEPKFLKVAYYEGSLRQDIVIDINNFPTYLEKQQNNEIKIIGVSLLSGDVYISEIKDAVQNDEPKDENLLTQMQLSDFRDKLIELGEDKYVDWIEKTAYKNLQKNI